MKQVQKYAYVHYTIPPNLKELEDKLEGIRSEKNAAVQSQEFEKAASFRDTEQKLKDELEKTKKDWKEKQGKEESEVTVDDIAASCVHVDGNSCF